jgi:hypothetical protein
MRRAVMFLAQRKAESYRNDFLLRRQDAILALQEAHERRVVS